MDTCQSFSTVEIKNLVFQHLCDCSPAQQVVFAACRVPFYACTRMRSGEPEDVLVVAELPNGILYFGEGDEGFGLGLPDGQGRLHCQGQYALALTQVLSRAGFHR